MIAPIYPAMLRGLPTVVSGVGGLPEAGLGLSAVVDVAPICIPINPRTLAPEWSRRSFPPQQVSERGRGGASSSARRCGR